MVRIGELNYKCVKILKARAHEMKADSEAPTSTNYYKAKTFQVLNNITYDLNTDILSSRFSNFVV